MSLSRSRSSIRRLNLSTSRRLNLSTTRKVVLMAQSFEQSLTAAAPGAFAFPVTPASSSRGCSSQAPLSGSRRRAWGGGSRPSRVVSSVTSAAALMPGADPGSQAEEQQVRGCRSCDYKGDDNE